MTEIPRINWAGFSLREKYEMVHAGPGAAAANAAAHGLTKLAPRFGESSDSLRGAVRAAGAEWRGQAATAFAGQMDQVTGWARRAGQAGQDGGSQIQNYGSSFDTARNKIPTPVEVGENSFLGRVADAAGAGLHDTFGTTFGVQSDYTKRLAAQRAADAAANHALAEHEELTRQAVDAFPESQSGTSAAARAGAPPSTTGGTTTAATGTAGGAGGGPAGAGVGPGGAGGGAEAGAAQAGATAPSAGTHSSGWAPSTAPGTGGSPSGGTSGEIGGGTSGATGPGTAGPRGTAPAAGAPADRPTLGYPGGGAARDGLGHPVSGAAGRVGSGAAGRVGSGAAGQRGLDRPTGLAGPAGTAWPATRTAPGTPPAPGASSGPPMGGLAGAGRGGEREHRNTVFLPSDEPFRVEPGEDVVPPVLG